MTTRRATLLVIRREFGERVRQRAFVISTIVTLVIVAGIALASGLLGDDDPQQYTVAAQGTESVRIAAAARASDGAFDVQLTVKRYATAAAARSAARDETVDAAVVGGALVSEDEPPAELEQLLQAATRQVRAAALLRDRGLSPADARRALAPAPLTSTVLSGGDDDARKGIAFAASLLLYLQLIIFGIAVASGVVEEKSSRVIEVLLAAVRPRALLTGKIVGIGLLGLLQLAMTLVVGLAVASASGAVRLHASDVGVFAVVLAWFVLGFLMFSAIYAISGVIVSRQEDLQSSSTPVTMVLVASYLLAFPSLENPDSPLAVIASIVPLSSPIVMPVRVVVGEASAVEIVASLGLLTLAIALLIPLGARIYEGAVLRMGKPMKLTEALRTARATR